MIRHTFLSLGTALWCATSAISADITPAPTATPATEPAPDATNAGELSSAITRSAALELAGAFANDGYKVRDGYLSHFLTKATPAILEVNLFAGNEYWFSASAPPQSPQKVFVTIFDTQGNLVDQQNFDEGFRFAAGFEPLESGRFFIKVSLIEGDPTPVSLVYSYK